MNTTPSRTLFYLAVLLPVVLSCSLAGKLKKVAEQTQKPTTITSTDSTAQLTLPPGWSEEKEKDEDSILHGSNHLSATYVVVIRESKQDFAEETTLADYAELTRAAMSDRVTSPHSTDVIPAYGMAYEAREFELECVVEKLKIKYLCTVVETPGNFYQVLTWTTPSRFTQNEKALRTVTQSFKELSSAASPTHAVSPG